MPRSASAAATAATRAAASAYVHCSSSWSSQTLPASRSSARSKSSGIVRAAVIAALSA